MVHIKSFKALRPAKEYVEAVAALPYDVYDEPEARRETAGHPFSFLRIDRPETNFPEGFDIYASEVYEKAAEILSEDKKGDLYKGGCSLPLSVFAYHERKVTDRACRLCQCG